MAILLTVNGFLTDTYLQKTSTVLIGDQADQGVGYLNSTLIDYFASPAAIEDKRYPRLITNGATAPLGTMRLHFDVTRTPGADYWSEMPTGTYANLFSILEKITYAKYATPITAIDSALQLDYPEFYVPGSINRSNLYTECEIPITNEVGTEEIITIQVPAWVAFVANIIVGSEIYNVTFNVYLDSTIFADEYPYTTITKVVPPCDMDVLLGTTMFENAFDAIKSSTLFANTFLDDAVNQYDQTGVYAFQVTFVASPAFTTPLVFQILHKGKKRPTTSDCRVAIRDYLVGLNVVSEDTLATMFPELFIDSIYYIVPLWDMVTVRVDKTIYPAITKPFNILTQLAASILKITESDFIQTGCIVLNGQNDVFSLVYPDPLNTDTTPLMEKYPTFTAHSSQEVEYDYMDDDDRALASKLNKCFAVLNGTQVNNLFTEQTVEELTYLTFTSGTAEFYVLTKESYATAVATPIL